MWWPARWASEMWLLESFALKLLASFISQLESLYFVERRTKNVTGGCFTMGKMFSLWLWLSAALFQTVLRNKPSAGRDKVVDQPTDGPTWLSWAKICLSLYIHFKQKTTIIDKREHVKSNNRIWLLESYSLMHLSRPFFHLRNHST